MNEDTSYKCACGCGNIVTIYRGKSREYLHGHNRREDIHVKYSINEITGCWEWQRNLNHKGYGLVRVGYKIKSAHRVMYELLKGIIPKGMQLHHTCRNKRCVNPKHLIPCNQSENNKWRKVLK